MANETKRFGWGTVIAAMIGVGIVVGLFFGMLGVAGLLPSAAIPVVIGVTCGFASVLLIARMRPAR